MWLTKRVQARTVMLIPEGLHSSVGLDYISHNVTNWTWILGIIVEWMGPKEVRLLRGFGGG